MTQNKEIYLGKVYLMNEIPLVNVTFNPYDMFEEVVDLLNDLPLVEISLKRSQITLIFDKEIIPLNKTRFLLDHLVNIDVESGFPYFTSLNDIPMIVIPDLKYNVDNLKVKFNEKNIFAAIVILIDTIAQKICSCPSLEIVFSSNYIKCYLDKPGLTVDDLKAYENLFGDQQGTLELHAQRPYLLFVNEGVDDGERT